MDVTMAQRSSRTYLDEELESRVEEACEVLSVEKSAFLRFCVVHTLRRLPEIQAAQIDNYLGKLIRERIGKKWSDEQLRLKALSSMELSPLDIEKFYRRSRTVPSEKNDVLAQMLSAIGLTKGDRANYALSKVTKWQLRSAFRSKVREVIKLTQLEGVCRRRIQRKSSRSAFLKKSVEPHRMLDLILSDMPMIERLLMQELFGIDFRQGKNDHETNESPLRGRFIYTPPPTS